MRKKNMDNIERKIEITREKLANLEEEYKKFWKKDTQKSEKNFITNFTIALIMIFLQ